jgi:hypothetical protein
MSNQQRSFEQVKSILGKLDRDIDAARERRLQSRPMPMTVNAPAGFVPPAPSQAPAPQPQAQPAPNDPGRHGYGRARPLRSEDRAAFPPSQPRP